MIDNRPGAGTNIGTEAVVRASADGYTLLLATSVNATNVTLYDKLSFDFIRDIAPVAGLISVPQVMEVNPSLPVKTVPEFIAYAKANPGKVNMGSTGKGTGTHLAGELFKIMAGISMVHVPYRGAAPMLTDLISGQVQVAFDTLPSSIEHIRGGRLRPLAVTTATRLDVLPELPPVGSFVTGYEATAWLGPGAPRNTSVEIVGKLNSEINAALVDQKLNRRIAELGGSPLVFSPAAFGKFVVEDTEKWAKVIKFARIRPE